MQSLQHEGIELDGRFFKGARYFIMKSYCEDDIFLSIKYGLWISTEQGNRKLDQAFSENKGPIYLFFSTNASGQFCGIAQMKSQIDYQMSIPRVQEKWKGGFKVSWLHIKDVPNSELRHISLPNNEGKPLPNSRDSQEIPEAEGRLAFRIFINFQSKTSILDDFAYYEKREVENPHNLDRTGMIGQSNYPRKGQRLKYASEQIHHVSPPAWSLQEANVSGGRQPPFDFRPSNLQVARHAHSFPPEQVPLQGNPLAVSVQNIDWQRPNSFYSPHNKQGLLYDQFAGHTPVTSPIFPTNKCGGVYQHTATAVCTEERGGRWNNGSRGAAPNLNPERHVLSEPNCLVDHSPFDSVLRFDDQLIENDIKTTAFSEKDSFFENPFEWALTALNTLSTEDIPVGNRIPPIPDTVRPDCCVCAETRFEYFAPVPCGHASCCENCLRKQSKCRICLRDIEQVIQIFLPS